MLLDLLEGDPEVRLGHEYFVEEVALALADLPVVGGLAKADLFVGGLRVLCLERRLA